MNRKILFNLSIKDVLVAIGPVGFAVILGLIFIYRNLDPAPPNQLTIVTGDDQTDLDEFAKEYQELLKEDGVTLHIKTSAGPIDNLKLLEDAKSNVSVAFVPDGLGSTDKQPDIVSLGSLYYEPLWVFYRGNTTLNHLSQLEGKKIAVGRLGRGTQVLADRLLRLSGVDMAQTKLLNISAKESGAALKKGQVDAAILLLDPQSSEVHELITDPDLHLMNILQAEAIARRDASFHHLVLPRGSLDLSQDLPQQDVNLISSTSTLLVRDDLHPALAFLLLKAAQQVHSGPGILEKRGEFPTNKDNQFSLSEDAIQFYKSGGPFWQRYLPYWLAAWLDRFVLLVIPVLAVLIPLGKMVPQIYDWRIRSRIHQRYGELKFLETQIKVVTTPEEYRSFENQLDLIEDRVSKMKVPKKFTEYIYSLRGHIQFVRDRLSRTSPKNLSDNT
jgi:TRAP-type uncharacterized transport system substrate-binding protein